MILPPPHDGNLNPEGNACIKLSISVPAGASTRAVEVDHDGNTNTNGETNEYAINNGKLYLFSNGTCSNIIDLNVENFADASQTDITRHKDYELDMPGVKAGSYDALVILNTEGLSDLPQVGTSWATWSANGQNYVMGDGSTNFTMTNALGWNGAQASTQSTPPAVLVPITADNFFYKTDDENIKKNKEAVTIFVQRVLAKVTLDSNSNFKITEASGSATSVTGNSGDQIKLTNWWLDILEPTTFPVQNLGTWYSTNSLITGWGSTELTSPLNRFVGGTSFTRIYWAEDPTYNNPTTISTEAEPTTINAHDAKLYCNENTFTVAKMVKNQSTRVVFKGTYTPATVYTEGTGTAGAAFVDYNGIAVKVKNVKETVTTSCSDKTLQDIVNDNDELAFIAAKLGLTTTSTEKVNYHKDGEVYYTAIIRHFDNTELGLGNDWQMKGESYGEAGKDTDTKYLGRYGVLRNNWYEIKINSISAPGTPTIPQPGDKPDDDPADQQINVTINVLTWAKRSQTVDF